jgi:hypothetical protein
MPNFVDPGETPASADFVSLSDYVGDVLIIEPTAYEEGFKTSNGPRDVMHATCGLLTSDGQIEGLGPQIIFWVKVIEQLRDALANDGIVVARLVREGRAYTLDSVDSATRSKAEKAYSWAE